ncbi:hypothetical protein GGD40_005632 [Paraburkholderia bryophila]|uniref:Uncharacterized protein n=1 Tax=Paraburkholderia bryophila TaxID=420952 RepID=A0A7Z0B8X1_9BURK|nr:hypothetical protein [Paraburkholderia bryophila]
MSKGSGSKGGQGAGGQSAARRRVAVETAQPTGSSTVIG